MPARWWRDDGRTSLSLSIILIVVSTTTPHPQARKFLVGQASVPQAQKSFVPCSAAAGTWLCALTQRDLCRKSRALELSRQAPWQRGDRRAQSAPAERQLLGWGNRDFNVI